MESILKIFGFSAHFPSIMCDFIEASREIGGEGMYEREGERYLSSLTRRWTHRSGQRFIDFQACQHAAANAGIYLYVGK